MNKGYIYCFVNSSMPDICKVGLTTRTPVDRLKEANSSDTYKPPTPYTVAFAKYVDNVKDKEKSIHDILSSLNFRINSNREFFRVKTEFVKSLFDLMEGEYWSEPVEDDVVMMTDSAESLIKHTIPDTFLTWFAKYNPVSGQVHRQGRTYFSIKQFIEHHYSSCNHDFKNIDFSECEIDTENGWNKLQF